MRIGVVKVQIRRDACPLHREHRLDETRHSGRRLEMTEIRLDRTDQQRRLLRTTAPQDRAERTRLDGIPQQSSGPMGLDIIHFMRRHPCVGVRRAQHRHLGGGVGGQQAVGPAVLVDRRTPHHCQQPIPVVHCITQPLEHDRPRSPHRGRTRQRPRRTHDTHQSATTHRIDRNHEKPRATAAHSRRPQWPRRSPASVGSDTPDAERPTMTNTRYPP